MDQHPEIRILLSGGGTGGHIFPAIAIAQELQALRPNVKILFVGAKGKMEMEKVPKAGYEIVGLPVSAFHRRLTWKNLFFPIKLIISLLQARGVVKRFEPHLAIGTGGFASGPILKASLRKGIPAMIQEQNAFPGVTNRLLAKEASSICVAHDHMEAWFPAEKVIKTGNPVRKDLQSLDAKKTLALSQFKLAGTKPIILIFGGSLGARAINLAVLHHLKELNDRGYDLIWQTGQAFYDKASEAANTINGQGIRVLPFIQKMELAYAVADLVVCRAGAITLSELALVGKPALLIPYPAAAGNHQMKNAQALEREEAAVILENDSCQEKLFSEIAKLMDNQQLRVALARNMGRLARPHAGLDIATIALEIVKEKHGL